MSKGFGPVQCRVLAVLYEEAAKEGLSISHLKALVGGDRSNLRRAIRTLTQRRLVEEATVESERLIRLTFIGELKAMPPLPKKEPDPLAELRAKWKEEDRERALEKERARLQAAEGPTWLHYEHCPIRRRLPGLTQERVLAVLWEYPDPVDEGLPVSVVKAIVSGDRSNTRRAIRTLLLCGKIEESEDSRHVRLSFGSALLFSIIPPIQLEPIDEERERAILRANGDR
jgi:DNA-binding MarR family transcriptional regulator